MFETKDRNSNKIKSYHHKSGHKSELINWKVN